jgi:hypothetical protein
MPMAREDRQSLDIVTSREPVALAAPGDRNSTGDQAFRDAMMILIGCAAFLALMFGSLHKHNA